MTKAVLLKVVNLALLVSFAAQVVTVIFIFFKIQTAYSMLIFEAHEYNGILLILLASAHLTLNWQWVRMNFFKKK